MFEELEYGNAEEGIQAQPNHFAVRQYKKYKLAAGKTAKSILISCGARLAPFDIAELRNLMSYDDMELDTLGDRKTALFIIISDTDDTFSFIAALMYSQLFNLLCDKADIKYGGRLPIHVRFLLDEFPNIGQIPKFEKLIATIRSREISACVVLQTQSQLKAIYKDNAETIIGNMDSRIFLGGSEKTTLKDLSESLGKETIDLLNNSISKGNNPSFSQADQAGAYAVSHILSNEALTAAIIDLLIAKVNVHPDKSFDVLFNFKDEYSASRYFVPEHLRLHGGNRRVPNSGLEVRHAG